LLKYLKIKLDIDLKTMKFGNNYVGNSSMLKKFWYPDNQSECPTLLFW